MAINIRPATVDDARAIASAHMRAWQVAYEGMVPQSYLDDMDLDRQAAHWIENLEAEELPNGLPAPSNYVAEIDRAVVGFVAFGVCRHAPDDSSLGQVWAIYVHPNSWGTGAGYRLMMAAQDDLNAAGVTTAYLWVLEDNAQARRFYERQGWVADDETMAEDLAGATIVERRYSITL